MSQTELIFHQSSAGPNAQINKRAKLALLLAGKLDFHGEKSGYASHDLHAFAAKFPPQLPRAFIHELTEPGDTVLDPMMGSGTTIVESLLAGRRGIGLDLDPLALRLTRVKITAGDLFKLKDAGEKVIAEANTLLSNRSAVEREMALRYDDRTKEFIGYWFLPQTQLELTALMLAIQRVKDKQAHRFLELIFSSIIVTKSGGVSRALDLAHSRPHLDKNKVPKNAVEQFVVRLRKGLASIAQVKVGEVSSFPIAGDARLMPLGSATIDLIVTSPPYANAIDYMRAHKFSLVWFGHEISELTKLRANYIGSERIVEPESPPLPDRAEETIKTLSELDKKKASILRKYFVEIGLVANEMYRVLKDNSAAIIVVGTSTMRGINVHTHLCLADISAGVGFDVVGIAERQLDRNKRMMPARFGKKSDSMIEQRMHEEYVVGLFKSAP